MAFPSEHLMTLHHDNPMPIIIIIITVIELLKTSQ